MTNTRPYLSAEKLLDELGITNPKEIDIEGIAEYCNAHIEYVPLKGCSGRILGTGDEAIISVSTLIPKIRHRFVAAHELGHWMCDRGKNAIAYSDNAENIDMGWDPNGREVRANKYAARLLMPTSLFKPRCLGKKPSFSLIEKLTESFNTSFTATALRFISCTDERCAIVFSKDSHICSFTPSQGFGYWIPVKQQLDKYSLAYDFFAGKSLSRRMEPVDVSCWLEGRHRRDAMIMEESRGFSDYNSVITLLWINKDIDIDDDDWDDRETFTPDGKYYRR